MKCVNCGSEMRKYPFSGIFQCLICGWWCWYRMKDVVRALTIFLKNFEEE